MKFKPICCSVRLSKAILSGLLFCLASELVATSAIAQEFDLEADAAHQQSNASNSVVSGTRSSRGLIALYDFQSTQGNEIRDRSGIEPPLHLNIDKLSSVIRKSGQLETRGPVSIVSTRKPSKLTTTVGRTGALTLEAWIKPASTSQKGPARIVSFSQDSNQRNFTLGQDADRFDFRLRNTATSTNGLPSTASDKNRVTTKLTHVVFTHRKDGKNQLYINGKKRGESRAQGRFTNWSTEHLLRLGDEGGGGRLWKGTYFLVAIYSRDLTQAEVQSHFRLGHNAPTAEPATHKQDTFASKIAPVLAEHCLECHDAATREGGLDLSHKLAALEGGESGKVILAGKPSESLLYTMVLANDMPPGRSPLTKEEKVELRRWIQAGANWSLDFVDAAHYLHDGGADQFWIQRLTVPEYIATVRMTLGVDISSEAQQWLPDDVRTDGFSNTAYNLSVDLKHIETYSRLAKVVTQRIDIAKFARRFTKKRRFTDKDVGELIEKMGRWVLRGPLSDEEVILYRGISTSVASAGGSFDRAASLILEAMIQSPRFLYRVESQTGDGFASPVSAFELASRMSFIIWGSSPDEDLFNAAASDELLDPRVMEKQIDRMLASPLAEKRAEQFVIEWLNLNALENLRPNADRFPEWSPRLTEDMYQETLQTFRHVALRKERPLHELLTAQTTFVTPRLARHYNLESELADEGNDQKEEFFKVDLESDPNRLGLLTQGSVLTVGGDDASMVTRGLFVLHDLLRGVVKDPPPCVDTTPVPSEPGLTQRMIASQRIKNEACGGCHSKFEPLAFGLGKFDGLGTFHEKDEHGNVLRDDGNILFPGDEKALPYSDVSELMRLLADSDRVRESLTWKVVQFAMSRPLTAQDAPLVKSIHHRAQSDGGTYRSLIKACVQSDLVQKIQTISVDGE